MYTEVKLCKLFKKIYSFTTCGFNTIWVVEAGKVSVVQHWYVHVLSLYTIYKPIKKKKKMKTNDINNHVYNFVSTLLQYLPYCCFVCWFQLMMVRGSSSLSQDLTSLPRSTSGWLIQKRHKRKTPSTVFTTLMSTPLHLKSSTFSKVILSGKVTCLNLD